MIQTKQYEIRMENGLMVFEAERASPILISVPHDGLPRYMFSGLFGLRENGCRGRDKHVWPVAKDILLSADVNAVCGLMPRAYIDYNRAWPNGINYYPLTQKKVHTAIDDKRLAHAYQHYHAEIDRILEISNLIFSNKNTLLIDLHGFGTQPPYAPEGGYDLIFGTGNRITIPHGNIDELLAEHMTRHGYKVFLPQDTSVGPLEDRYSADFTTRHHSEKHDINAIQIEIAPRFRKHDARELGQTLSRHFARFFRTHCL